MFALSSLRQVCKINNVIPVRNLRRRVANPGLENRLKAFQEEGLKIVDDDAEEFIENSSSDLFASGSMLKEHLKEHDISKSSLRHNIVRDKYFKVNTPNLLTWSEKEQIRHLCNEHPEEWTPERIAESFPVTVTTVKKLLKFPWKPTSEERIARHDASALRNWKELKEGTLDIPDNLRDHFLKFSNRTIPPLRASSIKLDLTQKQKIGEFQSIIEQCAQKEQENSKDNNQFVNRTSEFVNSDKPDIKTEKKRLTLDALQAKIENRLKSGKDVDLTDKMIIQGGALDLSKNSKENKELEIEYPVQVNEPVENQLSQYKETVKMTTYPERIRIPKGTYRKGATYKVNDCYYDHDGRFLYRVIGMS